MLKGKTVVLGVSGSIAAYKMANVASMLMKQHCEVHVIMTANAVNFIHPITFETLTNHKCLVDTFDRNFQYNVEHVALAKKADLMLIAPATANVIAKLAWGLADDMLSTTALACTCKKVVAPAMNTRMYENPVVQENMDRLKTFGFEVIAPETGMLACKDVGAGKLPDEKTLLSYVYREIACEKDLKGKRVLVTAGPTREALDPVRYLTNHSSGKMGYAVAKACMLRGARVDLITGPTAIEPPPFVNVIRVTTAAEMMEAVQKQYQYADWIIKAAAVADYRPLTVSEEKLKKSQRNFSISMERTEDILAFLGEHRREGQFLCGFSMETQNMLENSRKKLRKKNLDMIVANNVKQEGAGFETDTNLVTLITETEEISLPLMSKEEVAGRILDQILKAEEAGNHGRV